MTTKEAYSKAIHETSDVRNTQVVDMTEPIGKDGKPEFLPYSLITDFVSDLAQGRAFRFSVEDMKV